jgi:hypothetical protein
MYSSLYILFGQEDSNLHAKLCAQVYLTLYPREYNLCPHVLAMPGVSPLCLPFHHVPNKETPQVETSGVCVL